MKKLLFEQLPELLHGGDYNPEQWIDRPEILAQDIAWMQQAGINTVTLGVFAWSCYEPVEGEYHFEWLVERIEALYQAGIYTVLATPTGARPAWLDEAYPSALRVNRDGVRNRHGVRHNHCMSSPEFRQKVQKINTRLAQAVGNHPGVILWHISNELGGECCCPLCVARFQQWLEQKYGDIETLNAQWWTTFWSHRYNSFAQVEPPFTNGETSIPALLLDWKRFNTWNMADYLKFEQSILRPLTPHLPYTTNFMRLYQGLDYEVLAQSLDIISWDSYPAWGNPHEDAAQTALDVSFDHAQMRGFCPNKPFMLMESVPSLVNWHPYNKLKRPGMHLLSSLQAVAAGSDTVQYFQWRKGKGSFEQYHGAVIDHVGHCDTRVFREVAHTGEMLQKLQPVAGSTTKAQAALIFDWSNRWAIQDLPGLSKAKDYEETCRAQYRIFASNDVLLDVVPSSADFSQYRLLVLPMLYLLQPGFAAKLKQFVAEGGTVLATYLTGYVNENTLCYEGGFPGDGLREMFGLWSEEIDSLYPQETNSVVLDGVAFTAKDYCEVLRVDDAEVLACYTQDFYAGTPCLTKKAYGKGFAYYVGARLENDAMQQLYRKIWAQCGLTYRALPHGMEHLQRANGMQTFDFYFNHTAQPLQLPSESLGFDLLSGQKYTGGEILPPLGAVALQNEAQP